MSETETGRRVWIDRVLYGTITTTAVLFGVQIQDPDIQASAVVGLIWATGLGLLVAHGVAGALAHRLTTPGRHKLGVYSGLFREELPLLIPAAAATVGVTLGSLRSDEITTWIRFAELAMAILAGGIAYFIASAAQVQVWRRFAYATIIVGIVLGAAVTKLVIGK